MILKQRCIEKHMIQIKYVVGVVILWLSNNTANTSITNKQVNTEVLVGDSTYLNCSLFDASTPISWYHFPVGKETDGIAIVCTNGIISEPYQARFRIEGDNFPGAFNLVIEKVEIQDAGLYICQDGITLAASQLIVLESLPECLSNIDSEGLIGPNSCGLQIETIQLSCSVRYSGYIAPELNLIRLQGDSSTLCDHVCSKWEDRIVCNYTTEADTELDGSSFACEVRRTANSRYKCATETVRIFHALENKTAIPKDIGDVVICAEKESSRDCNYKWIRYYYDHEETVSKTNTLTVNDTGLFQCEASCRFKESECIFVPMTIDATGQFACTWFDYSTAVAIAVIILTTLAAVNCILICVEIFLKRIFRRKRR